ncbi:MAG: TIGR04282 family arsenosugar biosynthesis glycosyltransferase [Gammaproteobacteria bacterium]
MNGAAAVFVKTPGLSPLKTRLAAGIGQAAAEHWYRLAAEAVAEALAWVPELTTYWAVAEPVASAASAWPGLSLIGQGEGELGERMGQVHATLLQRHDFVLLLGADTPQLEPSRLAEAAGWLTSGAPRLVMGQARDGGFWLLGANRDPAPSDWLRAPCGRADTALGFRDAMAHLGEWRLLPELTDVDEAQDLDAMLAELGSLEHPLPAQLRLAAWTRALRRQ